MRASNPSMNRRRFALLIGTLAVVMAGCGGSGDAATTRTTSTSAAPTTEATSTTSTAPATTSTTAGRPITTTTLPATTVAPVPPQGTGAYGVVAAGPTCPVQRVDQPCPPEPLSVQLDAQDSGGHTVARTHTDGAGHYQLPLAPGDYILVVEVSGMFPRCPATAVTVTAGPAQRHDINCDTGIR